jgi:hypothetical protein
LLYASGSKWSAWIDRRLPARSGRSLDRVTLSLAN